MIPPAFTPLPPLPPNWFERHPVRTAVAFGVFTGVCAALAWGAVAETDALRAEHRSKPMATVTATPPGHAPVTPPFAVPPAREGGVGELAPAQR